MNLLAHAEDRRRKVGLVALVLGDVSGLVLLLVTFFVPPLVTGQLHVYAAMAVGAVIAFPAALMYLTVPRLLDRYDPEPAYALLGCLTWGALAACGYSAVVNSAVSLLGHELGGPSTGDILGAVLSAPLVEEGFKGIGVFGVFYFLRREFDGVVDGIIYATFIAIGFAAVENVIYYAGSAASGEAMFGMTVLFRGVLAPWGHPLYTAMTGIGLGLARESTKPWVQALGPILGYSAAVLLHAAWNGSATLAGIVGEGGALLFLVLFPLWLIFVATFLVIVMVLVHRRGRIIRQHLLDEVAMGNLTPYELDLVCSAFGLLRAKMRFGDNGVAFVRACARLALSKWHGARAYQQSTHTISMDFIVPLRRRIRELKAAQAGR